MYPHTINIDWLQIYLHDENQGIENLAMIYNGKSSYAFQTAEYTSRQFSQVYDIYDSDGDHYAVLQRIPFSNIISYDGAILKLANRELYKSTMIDTLILFLEYHRFAFKSISRLDICFDSNTLKNGLKHSTLIRGLQNGKYLKNNQGQAKQNFEVQSKTNRIMECNSISFGSLSSAVKTKMYNKTKEMNDVKYKPYIVESWQKNGIDTNKDVWRIEISIKADMTNIVKLDTVETFRLTTDRLKLSTDIQNIFYTYAARYFSFKINDGKKNKTRMPSLEIFPERSIITSQPIRITLQNDESRSDKIFLNKLHRIQVELRNIDDNTLSAIEEVRRAFCIATGLSKYYNKKIRIKNERRK